MVAEKVLSEELSTLARAMSSEADVRLTMDTALSTAVAMIDGCDEAAIALIDKKAGLETLVSTSAAAARGDALQSELGEGPCLDAAWREETVSSADLTADARWPTWGPRVTEEIGVRSMLCFQLFVTKDSLGALDMYSRSVDGFTDDDHVDGRALAAQIAVALVAARHIDNLNLAMANRTVIGEAKGILMERFDLDSDQAFAVVRRMSEQNNRKLHEVASEIVRTRKTPGDPDGRR